MSKPSITTHVLDTARGRPAVGVAVDLERQVAPGDWQAIGAGTTNRDGRITDLMSEDLRIGRYRLRFATREYFAGQVGGGFYPSVLIEFEVEQPEDHYHVPLLLSPFGYSTYRGS